MVPVGLMPGYLSGYICHKNKNSRIRVIPELFSRASHEWDNMANTRELLCLIDELPSIAREIIVLAIRLINFSKIYLENIATNSSI